ncbi:hypothetical protein FA13DRAFT_1260553 [Coprinellus micaceus]|uniref:Uncharacterized protein n=1 Tax=Coprinellus micaceus TaxID=71717 RepID=A0A4Y7STK8_COPMI|nr:hypothetical protein FA13DRAFT_1260553 [Coprinellus micaceus]
MGSGAKIDWWSMEMVCIGLRLTLFILGTKEVLGKLKTRRGEMVMVSGEGLRAAKHASRRAMTLVDAGYLYGCRTPICAPPRSFRHAEWTWTWARCSIFLSPFILTVSRYTASFLYTRYTDARIFLKVLLETHIRTIDTFSFSVQLRFHDTHVHATMPAYVLRVLTSVD